MLTRLFALAAALLVVTGCGSSSNNSPGATASSVSVQPGDLPSGLQKCDASGDIAGYLTKTQTSDPSVYATAKASWADAQTKGATAAYVTFYSDSTASCAALASSSNPSAATTKAVIGFVFQFKDEATAAKGYTSESIFGFSVASMKSGGAPAVEGTSTGLTPNSIVLSAAILTTSFYVAVWQKKAFMVILAVENLDPVTGKKVALAENGRIR
jgi:hypothetical protein